MLVIIVRSVPSGYILVFEKASTSFLAHFPSSRNPKINDRVFVKCFELPDVL